MRLLVLSRGFRRPSKFFAVGCVALLAATAYPVESWPQSRAIANGAGPGSPVQAPRPAHGGDLRLAGPFWLELVVAKGSLTVYVSNRSGAPIDASTGKGTAVVHTDGKSTRIELKPGGGDRLVGKGRVKVKRTTVIFVTAALRGEKAHRAVFRPFESAPDDR